MNPFLVLLASFYNEQFLTGAKIFRQFSVQPNREYKVHGKAKIMKRAASNLEDT